VVSFIASPLSTCPGSTVTLTDMSANSPNAWAWTISPNTFSYVNSTSASSQNPQVQFSAPGTYTVSLTATNPFGSSSSTQTNYITITSGAVPNVVEDFQGSFLPAGWAVVNSGGAYTWTQSQSITGINGSPTLAAYVENFSYNSAGALDYLVMEPIDLTNSSVASMQFDLAYARYSSTLFERLYIEVSTDCGQTFPNVVYDKADTILATVGDQAGNWFPSNATDWRTETVDLMPFIGNTIVIRFVNVNGYGNNLFVDNVNVTQTVAINPGLGELGMSIWPNPNAGTFNVSVPKLAAGPASMSVFDLTGRKVYQNEWLADGNRYQTVVDLRSITKGVYFLKLESQGASAIQKVVIE
jgi:PKD repeat protein